MSSQELKVSSERIGQLYPILVDYHGNIIDGEHRFRANNKWKKVKLEHIKTEKDGLIARIVSNTIRRNVSREEKRNLLGGLGEIYLREGIEPGKIAYAIARETGMSYRWVMKYLPNRFKDTSQSERRKTSVARRATTSTTLANPPKDVLGLTVYKNANFVNFFVEKTIYEKLEDKAKKLGATPTKLLYNAILLILRT